MTMDDSAVFVDANVLIYADLVSSPFHVLARKRLSDLHAAGAALWISGQIIREYLVALTRGQSFSKPVQSAEAARSARMIIAQMTLAPESTAVAEHLLDLVARFDVRGKQTHDANVVATMLCHGVKKPLTHNVADFDRYGGIIEVLPLQS
jgi:predicted nucleic acid-binding protein